MLKYILLTITLILWSFPLHAQKITSNAPIENNTQPEDQEIHQSFNKYKQALEDKDGSTASNLITQDSIQIYEYYRQAALSGKQEDILQVPLIHQATILILRGSIPSEALIKMSGKNIYAECINNGFVANKWTDIMSIINIETIDPKTAILTIGVKDQPGTELAMIKEGNIWKISIKELLVQSDEIIEKMLKEKGIPPKTYLKGVVESQLGKDAFPKIWNPPAVRVLPAQSVWETTPE